MDFAFTLEEERFRQEVRDFIQREVPSGWTGFDEVELDGDEEWNLTLEVTRQMGRRGWLTLSWPPEHGGVAPGRLEPLIFAEELAYRRVPLANEGGGSWAWVGPTLIKFGSPRQQQEFLPRIARAELIFCTLYTEPGAGSDLAGLQTRAVADGDDYLISGQKVFITGAHRSDYGWLVARTDPQAPKHKGISLFVLDMKSPGVSIRPLINMAGLHFVNEVFLDNVRVPRANLVGEANRGWYEVAVALDFERSGVGYAASARRLLEELVEHARRARRGGRPLAEDPRVRGRLAELAIEVEVGRLISYRVASQRSRGLVANVEASMSKLWGTELRQRVARVGMQLLGLAGQLSPGSLRAPLWGRVGLGYLVTVHATISAGTSEIQRNIIATRGLGLPRSY